ncbi:hypothetical protein BZG36_01369 [Bifiguratus adelaidae]|uniref:6-pyruvoyltetrahydropterin synthase n=1 Tax=Bifiguratus adelaidae TaxID=1938954 RepID=A0A261Y3B5_9FUNG|nr:hypothetical protein BZG36_01369 [Bifiguratus adelaidae]
MVIGYICRSQSFSAAHRLHSAALSAEENRALYGKCNNPNFHGHNYKVEVTIYGPINPFTGMIVHIADVKDCIDKAIMKYLDHRNLDLDVAWFSHRPSTTENLAIFIWMSMKRAFKPIVQKAIQDARVQQAEANADVASSHFPKLYEVRLHETENNMVIFRGDGLTEEDFVAFETEMPVLVSTNHSSDGIARCNDVVESLPTCTIDCVL